MTQYVVVTPTGPHAPGEVVEISEEQEKAGVDVQRLINLGAIREATDDDAEGVDVVPLGTSFADRLPQLIPHVEPKPAAIKPSGGRRNGGTESIGPSKGKS